MNLLILSRYPEYYSTKRLVTEAHKKGIKTGVIDPLGCTISLSGPARSSGCSGRQSGFKMSSDKDDMSGFDTVIPRIGIIGIDYALLVAHHLEFMGIPLVNSARSLSYTKNKFQCLQILCKSGIPVPETVMTRNASQIDKIIKQLDGLPLVMKLFRGSQGKGVMLGENPASIESILTAVWAIGFDIILQKYLKETSGEDIRILVLNNEIIAAMKRIPAKNDFRSNIHQGGRSKKVKLFSDEIQMALKATKSLGLNLAGVDIMRTRKGPLALEVNASPGFEGLEKVTHLNIARRIVEFAIGLTDKKL